MRWYEDLNGDRVNLSLVQCIRITNQFYDYRFRGFVVVEASTGDELYPLWAEKCESEPSTHEYDKTLNRAKLFVDTLVRELNK